MVTTDIINRTYIERIIARDDIIIRQTQSDVISSYLINGTGRLNLYIKNAHNRIEGIHFIFPILNYLRFLDMKKTSRRMMAERRHLALYNRVVWGVLYHETLPSLRYGLTKDIRNGIKNELIAATQQQKIVFPE